MYYGVTRLVCQLREHDSISPRKNVLDWSTSNKKVGVFSPFFISHEKMVNKRQG